MSLTLNMVGGGGGGDFPTVGAILRAFAPVGSTVSITDGNKTKTVESTESQVDTVDSTRAYYYFSIPTDEYGTWTVTGTLNGQTYSDSVSVSSNTTYDVIIAYPLYLYKYGDTCDSVTGGWHAKAWKWSSNTATAKAPTITYNSDNMNVSVTNGGGAAVTTNSFNVTYYNTLKVRAYYTGDAGGDASIMNNLTATYYSDATAAIIGVQQTTVTDFSANISSLTGNKWFAIEVSKTTTSRAITVYEIVLER